ELDHAREQFVGGGCQAGSCLRHVTMKIKRKAAALPDVRTSGGRCSVQQYGKGVAQHGGAGRREQAHTALDAAIDCSLDQIRRVKCVELVDLHVSADLNVPVQPFLEHAAP